MRFCALGRSVFRERLVLKASMRSFHVLVRIPNERIFEVMILDEIHTLSLWNCSVADNG